jgi:hypothetical protein
LLVLSANPQILGSIVECSINCVTAAGLLENFFVYSLAHRLKRRS